MKHHELSYPDSTSLQASVDAFMASFDELEAARIRAQARLRNEPDEDGFITVTRGGRAAPARAEDAERARERMKEKEEKKAKELANTNFYRFQGREKRKMEQAELMKRFEEDRKKVNEMRGRRGKFRPE
jgi:ribosomal RNA-processing protein 7